MRLKTAILTTDMPISPDLPIDFGVQLFCSECKKCARECPPQAIPYGDKVILMVMKPGSLTANDVLCIGQQILKVQHAVVVSRFVHLISDFITAS